ncbi:Protein kinase byr1 [Symbiodinium microadriaticum]|uniref:Protein kinase byr1 n=1 Tax=Symbiodinium microadriaticum TaxID=2951 RepID=A0A1Q9CIM6_SYMMI|nr:Protein kinase byr1 [Symbiodinium microadriaticum]
MFGARLVALAAVWLLPAGAPPAPEDECTLELQSNLTEAALLVEPFSAQGKSAQASQLGGCACPSMKIDCSKGAGGYFVAFYAFSKKGTDQTETVVETRLVTTLQDTNATVCSGTYKVTKGRCFGIDVTKPEHIPAEAPPPPPERDGMPGPFPTLDDEGKTIEATTTTTTTAPSPSKGNHGHVGWIVAVVVLLVLAALYIRHQRVKGMPGGTPGYMPPETIQQRKWLPRGDVFCLGVTFIQVLLDKSPPTGPRTTATPGGIFVEGCQTIQDIFNATITRKPPLDMMPAALADLTELLDAMLNKDVTKRPTASQVLGLTWFEKALTPASKNLRLHFKAFTV